MPLTLAALLLASCAAEAGAPDAQASGTTPALELTGRVVDAADILSPQFEMALTGKLAALEGSTGVQLVVATSPDLRGEPIDTYSLNLANAWGIGSAERNDGLLMLVAPNERRVRIEVGYGLEASVRDEDAAKIIQNDILPHFRNADYETGVAAGVDSLIEEVTPHQLKEAA